MLFDYISCDCMCSVLCGCILQLPFSGKPLKFLYTMIWTSKTILCSWDSTYICKQSHQLLPSIIRSLWLGSLNLKWCTSQCQLSYAYCVTRQKKTVVDLLSAFPRLVLTAYLHCHNLVFISDSYLVNLGVPTDHRPFLVLESSVAKIPWDFGLHTVHNYGSK